MRSEIITLLRQRGTYVSGQELCERFGVSRTAVWKAVEQLKKDGYEIEAVKNRGYLLKEDATRVFGLTEIESRLKTDWIGQNLHYFETIDSTNTQAKRLAEKGAPDGTLVVADTQTAGRGRRGRSWASPAGTNLYFTVLLRPQIAPDKASMLTLVMALAVARGIQAVTRSSADLDKVSVLENTGLADNNGPKVGIKWPNDIVVDGKKVCGILTEMSLSLEQGSIDYVVTGVGINVAAQKFDEEICDRAVSLEEIFGTVNRCKLLDAVLRAFEGLYSQFLEKGDLSSLKASYDALLVNFGRQVHVLDPKGEYDGIARGIRDTGELMVEIPGKEIRDVYAGEVSVRGIYGYV